MSALDKDDAGPLKGDPAAAGEPGGNEAKPSDAASAPDQEAACGRHADKSAADESQAAGQTSSDSSAKDASSADAQADDKTDSDSAKEDGTDKESEGLTPLGQAKKEAADYLEALQRERAEFVNFRNRAKKEQDIFRQHGIVDVLTALLPALDDIDRIKEHGQMDDSRGRAFIWHDLELKDDGLAEMNAFGANGGDFESISATEVRLEPRHGGGNAYCG